MVTFTRNTDPISWNTPIVNPENGYPTAEFIRQFNGQRLLNDGLGQVLGLLQVDLIAGAGLTGGGALANLTDITFTLDNEYVQDLVGAMISGSSGVTSAYNDTLGTISLTLDTEYVQDIVGAMLNDSTELDYTYDDTTGLFTAVLKTTGVTNGTYGSGTISSSQIKIPSVTVDTKGRLTAASETAVDVFYDINVFIAGKPTAGELVYRHVAVRAFTLPASLTGSYASSVAASAANKDFTLKKNGSSIGTVSFNTSATGTFTFSSSVSFAAGDVLTIEAPAVADTTLSDITLSFKGTR